MSCAISSEDFNAYLTSTQRKAIRGFGLDVDSEALTVTLPPHKRCMLRMFLAAWPSALLEARRVTTRHRLRHTSPRRKPRPDTSAVRAQLIPIIKRLHSTFDPLVERSFTVVLSTCFPFSTPEKAENDFRRDSNAEPQIRSVEDIPLNHSS